MSHTRGPWNIWKGKGGMPRIIATDDGASVADANAGFPCSAEEQDANARLIAAAPDLLAYAECEAAVCTDTFYETLKRHGYEPGKHEHPAAFLEQLRTAAIAKATDELGRQLRASLAAKGIEGGGE